MRAGGGEGFVPRGSAASCLGRRGKPRRINRARLAAVERRLPARLLQRAEGGYRGIVLRHAYILSAVVGCGRTYVIEGVCGVSGEVIAAGLADIGGAAATGLGSEIKAADRGFQAHIPRPVGKPAITPVTQVSTFGAQSSGPQHVGVAWPQEDMESRTSGPLAVYMF